MSGLGGLLFRAVLFGPYLTHFLSNLAVLGLV